jgi:hypothetical protein
MHDPHRSDATPAVIATASTVKWQHRMCLGGQYCHALISLAVRSKVPASPSCTANPRWSRDGRHLFYRTDDWKLMRMSVSGTEEMRLGKPEMLMQLPQDADFEISNDNRFLVSSPNGRLVSPLMVVANWHPEAFASR